jgi:hypothetical protein
MDTDNRIYFLEEVFDDDTFIFEVRGGSDPGFFKRGYQVNEENVVDFTGEPVKVVVEKTYTPVQGNSQTEGGLETMAKDKKGCCPEKVNLIIQSELTRFEESDREYLEALEEGTLVKLLPITPEPQEAPQVNKEQIVEIVREQFKTKEQWLSAMPAEMREPFEHGAGMYQEQRGQLINHITANAGDSGFTAEELANEPISKLKKLASLAKAPADFSGLNSGTKHQANNEVAPQVFPVGVE